ncbi:cyclic GMP-AMP synthase [Bacteroidia bacterium]|nr:cyclic GMP-AMP synthase [Bacteroidia bacterium]
MANNHSQFIAFNDSITISKAKKETLKNNREALREKIRKYFKDNKPDEINPSFRSQGSFVMKTLINPISEWSEEDEKYLYKYDIDDGVYFIGKEEDRKSIDTYHNWIYEAVKDHTDKGATDKTTCVRVLYADGHHIDLPIYFKIKGDDTIPQLAHKSKDWIDSDPKEFFDWFNKQAKDKEQLRRIVRYLKAWRDYRHTQNSSTQMPSGFILTILATNNISYSNDRDDIALKETLEKIQNAIDPNHGGTFECYRPTTPADEDLFENYSDTKRDYFLSQLDSFVKSAKNAIGGTNPKESCEKWQKHFGDRFSCATAIDEDEAKEKAKAFTEGKLKYGATGLSTTVGTAMAANKGFYGDI